MANVRNIASKYNVPASGAFERHSSVCVMKIRGDVLHHRGSIPNITNVDTQVNHHLNKSQTNEPTAR